MLQFVSKASQAPIAGSIAAARTFRENAEPFLKERLAATNKLRGKSGTAASVS